MAAGLAAQLDPSLRVAVWAVSELETCAAVVGALAAGAPVVPINPKSGERELEHMLADSEPAQLLTAPGLKLPAALAGVPRLDVDLEARGDGFPAEPGDEAPAIVVYTSGTTGPPKGRCSRGARSPRTSTRWPPPGSGRPTTCSPTGCRCSTSTA